MPECDAIREEFSPLLDGELSPDQQAAVEAHLALCSECLRELDRYKKVTELYRAMAPVAAPAGFEDRIARALRPRVIGFHTGRHARRRLWPLLAAAAVLLVCAVPALWPIFHAPDRADMRLSKLDTGAAPEDVLETPTIESKPRSAPMLDILEPADDATSKPASEKPKAPPQESPSPADVSQTLRSTTPKSIDNLALSTPKEEEQYTTMPKERAAADISPSNPPASATAVSAPPPVLKNGIQAEAQPTPVPAPPLIAKEADRAPMVTVEAHVGASVDRQGSPSARKIVANRTFVLENDIWRQEDYAGAQTVSLTRDSGQFKTLCELHPEVAEFAALGPRVIFYLKDIWYSLEPTAAQ